jgi:hypothetical protein
MIGNNFKNINFESYYFKSNSTLQFETEYKNVLIRATVLGYNKPTLSQQIKQNTLCKNFKSNGAFNLNDLILVLANNGSKEFACINWKNPNGNLATLINSPIFTINAGFTGRGSPFFDYIATGYNPDGTLNYKINNASRFCYVKQAVFNRVLDGVSANTSNTITSLPSIFNKINQGGNNLLTNLDFSGTGMMSIHRTSATNIIGINNTTQTPATQASTGLSLSEQNILRSFTSYGTQQISFYSMGAQLVSQNNQIVTDFENYLNSL